MVKCRTRSTELVHVLDRDFELCTWCTKDSKWWLLEYYFTYFQEGIHPERSKDLKGATEGLGVSMMEVMFAET